MKVSTKGNIGIVSNSVNGSELSASNLYGIRIWINGLGLSGIFSQFSEQDQIQIRINFLTPKRIF